MLLQISLHFTVSSSSILENYFRKQFLNANEFEKCYTEKWLEKKRLNLKDSAFCFHSVQKYYK